MTAERIIKSKQRVQQHGEVFTPLKTVKQMLDVPGVKEACESVTTTFLEPAAGEGVFLVEILERKLDKVVNQYGDSIKQYEMYALLALSSLYGVELLEDNAQRCTMKLYRKFVDYYYQQVEQTDSKVRDKVLDSASLIISKNIVQGNFLTRLNSFGSPIVFSEWKPVKYTSSRITIQRTEYTLDEIYEGTCKESGHSSQYYQKIEQLSLFELDEEPTVIEHYIPCSILDVYKEEIEVEL
ncbi:methylase [Aerococcaceae bacterium NML180378]|nr:methylase [Aerococcaceae bacterium NML180378]